MHLKERKEMTQTDTKTTRENIVTRIAYLVCIQAFAITFIILADVLAFDVCINN